MGGKTAVNLVKNTVNNFATFVNKVFVKLTFFTLIFL